MPPLDKPQSGIDFCLALEHGLGIHGKCRLNPHQMQDDLPVVVLLNLLAINRDFPDQACRAMQLAAAEGLDAVESPYPVDVGEETLKDFLALGFLASLTQPGAQGIKVESF